MDQLSASIHPSFWFRWAVPCRKLTAMPSEKGDGLLNLPADCRIVAPSDCGGKPPWAEVRMAWNRKGLGISLDVSTPLPKSVGRYAASTPAFRFFIDTRDTREVHRAGRFCQAFTINPLRIGDDLEIVLERPAINRAAAEPPKAPENAILTKGAILRSGWRIEIFLTAEGLNGFDPDTNRRLGYTHQISDGRNPDLFFGVGNEFPISEDPSLWSTLELVDQSPAR